MDTFVSDLNTINRTKKRLTMPLELLLPSPAQLIRIKPDSIISPDTLLF